MIALLSVIPDNGANIVDLALKGTFVLDGYSNADDLKERKEYKSEILAPFPNRLAKGKFNFEGQDYNFPINDIEHGHALHGFVANKSFEIIEEEISDSLFLKLKYTYREDDNYFPFKFDLFVSYRIIENQFHVKFEVENRGGKKLPFGIGWHPYFIFKPNEKASIESCPMEQLLMDHDMIPNGVVEQRKFDIDLIEKLKLDDTFIIDSFDRKAFLIFRRSLNSGKILTLKFKSEQESNAFKYLQLYHNPGSDSIAMEPMSCNVDALNNGQGLVVLESGEKKSYKILLEADLV